MNLMPAGSGCARPPFKLVVALSSKLVARLAAYPDFRLCMIVSFKRTQLGIGVLADELKSTGPVQPPMNGKSGDAVLTSSCLSEFQTTQFAEC